MYNIHRDDGLVKMRIKKERNEKKKKETTDVDVPLFIYISGREKDTYVQIELISTHEKRFGRRPPFFLYILFQFLH